MHYGLEWGERIEQLSFWLKQLIVVLILAGFLELTLPDNQLKGVAKLIMGLLIILLLIQPVAQLIHLPLAVAWVTPKQTDHTLATEQVIEEGLRLRNNWQQHLATEQEKLWEEKITQVSGMISGVKVTKVVVDCEVKTPIWVKLWVSPKITQGETWWRKDIEQRLKNGVRLVSDLAEEKIEVNWND